MIVNSIVLFSSFFSQTSMFVYMNVLIFLGLIFQGFPKFPELRSLKKLTLIVTSYRAHSLLCCTSVLKASPFLQKFTLEVNIVITLLFIILELWTLLFGDFLKLIFT